MWLPKVSSQQERLGLPPRAPAIAVVVGGLLLLFAVPALLRIGPPLPPLLVVLAILASGAFLALAPDLPAPLPAAAWRPATQHRLVRLALAGLLLLGSVTLWLLAVRWSTGPAADKTLALVGGLCWLGSLGLYAGAVAVGRGWRPRWAWPALAARLSSRETLAVAGLTVLAFVPRIYQLSEQPMPFHVDEGSIGLVARLLASGQAPEFFYADWAGQARLAFTPAALFVSLFGPEILAVRLPSALMGTATVPLLYLLGRRMFGPLVGLLAAALMATWHYTIHFSRIGHNQMGDALLAVLVFWLLYRAVETEAPLDYLWAGVATGLTWYSYPGARLVFGLALLFLAFTVVRRPRQLRARLPNLAIFAGAALLTAVPQLLWFQDHQDILNERFNQTGIVQTGWLATSSAARGVSPLLVLLEQLLPNLLVYVAVPPSSISLYVTGRPLLDSTFALLALLGLAYSLLRLFEPRYWLLQSWFWATVVIGGTLTMEPPMVARLVLAAPAVCLFMALAFGAIAAGVQQRERLPRLVVPAVASALVAVLLVTSLQAYFGGFLAQNNWWDQGGEIAQRAAEFLRERRPPKAYLTLAPRLPTSYAPLRYLLPDLQVYDIQTPYTDDTVPEVAPGERAVFLILAERRADLDAVRARYPEGQWRELRSRARPIPLLYAYEVAVLPRR